MVNENVMVLSTDTLITAVFRQPESAETAYHTLIREGYKNEDINLIMSDKIRDTYFSNTPEAQKQDLGTKSLEGLGVGAVTGGMVGALAAALAAVGTSLLLPGLGLVISGPLAASLAGAGAGAAAGGLVGTLVGFGLPDDKAKLLEDEIKKGSVVIGIKPKNEKEHNRLMQVLDSSFDSLEAFSA